MQSGPKLLPEEMDHLLAITKEKRDAHVDRPAGEVNNRSSPPPPGVSASQVARASPEDARKPARNDNCRVDHTSPTPPDNLSSSVGQENSGEMKPKRCQMPGARDSFDGQDLESQEEEPKKIDLVKMLREARKMMKERKKEREEEGRTTPPLDNLSDQVQLESEKGTTPLPDNLPQNKECLPGFGAQSSTTIRPLEPIHGVGNMGPKQEDQAKGEEFKEMTTPTTPPMSPLPQDDHDARANTKRTKRPKRITRLIIWGVSPLSGDAISPIPPDNLYVAGEPMERERGGVQDYSRSPTPSVHTCQEEPMTLDDDELDEEPEEHAQLIPEVQGAAAELIQSFKEGALNILQGFTSTIWTSRAATTISTPAADASAHAALKPPLDNLPIPPLAGSPREDETFTPSVTGSKSSPSVTIPRIRGHGHHREGRFPHKKHNMLLSMSHFYATFGA